FFGFSRQVATAVEGLFRAHRAALVVESDNGSCAAGIGALKTDPTETTTRRTPAILGVQPLPRRLRRTPVPAPRRISAIPTHMRMVWALNHARVRPSPGQGEANPIAEWECAHVARPSACPAPV